MLRYFLQGMLIGLIFGIPVGAVGTMTVQRTLRYGTGTGLLTGLGSSAADCIYASIGAFGLTVISDFLLAWQDLIHFGGGCLILAMGVWMLRKRGGNAAETKRQKHASPYVEARKEAAAEVPPAAFPIFLSSFAVGITNPAAILTFLLAFSWFGIGEGLGALEGVLLVGGVFLGTWLWWCILTAACDQLRRRAKKLDMGKLNKVFGCLLCGFGAVILAGIFG